MNSRRLMPAPPGMATVTVLVNVRKRRFQFFASIRRRRQSPNPTADNG